MIGSAFRDGVIAIAAVIVAALPMAGGTLAVSPESVDTSARVVGVQYVEAGLGEVSLSTLSTSAVSQSVTGRLFQATSCPKAITGSTAGAPSKISKGGVAGTTSADLASFAKRFNEIRVSKCLPPVPFRNIRYDSCMEKRLFWMAEDPSTNPMSAWGHRNQVKRSDGVPDTGCDGNLAGGSGNTGKTVAEKWWNSTGHRASLYKPTIKTSMSKTCILFAMTHGGVPNEPYSFTRAAARWITCP